MTRYQCIERILRQVYGEQPTDDSNVTTGLVNQWVTDAIASAAKANYKESIQIEGVNYVNNSFYTTFKNLPIVAYEPFTYQISLPQIPVGIGKNEGISSLTIVDSFGNISYDALLLSENQVSYYRAMPKIHNKILAYPEGIFVNILSSLLLNVGFTARVKMISGGDSTNLNSLLNVPDDYIPLIIEYAAKMLIMERQQVKDIQNDGEDS